MSQMKKVKIGIVGHGFVGKTTDWGFNKNVEKFIVDPIYENTIDDLSNFKPKIVFVCVPTPMQYDGDQDASIILDVIKELKAKCKESIIVVKSTVLPSILKSLESLCDKLIYNPEFLREKNAKEDFKNSSIIIFGGNRTHADEVSKIYLHHSRCLTTEHFFTDLITASLIKYTINTFLATKVLFFNEIHSIFKSSSTNTDWEEFIKIISFDERIGASHMSVPGHDGKKGFGGACFPKDISAFIKYADKIGTEVSLIKSVQRENNSIRRSYKDTDHREKEQNISYDDNI